MENLMKMDAVRIGVDYYPEHWDKSLWESDLSLMEECGIYAIRIAEFAWNKFEPKEDCYIFDFFDDFMQVVANHKIKVIFCTPTATPPAWLTEKYPEVLNTSIDGVPIRHGLRRHYTYNSDTYIRLSQRIVEQLALHYGHHPAIIGWQLDNEFNCGPNLFYSASDHCAFREYVKSKYKTLDQLNNAWGTEFWNQIYSDWNEVFLPRIKPCNPHMSLDERRFVSDSCILYAKMQSDTLRKHIDEHQFITTNGVFDHIDYHKLCDTSIDFITYDSYPNFGYIKENLDPQKDRKWIMNLSRVRAISPVFGIMEQQSGANGSVTGGIAPSPRPGQMRLWSFQSIAHGADFICFFRWRTCSYGTEIYWHGILDYANIPNRRLKELKQINADVMKIAELAGSRYQADIAMIRDYDNVWDAEIDEWTKPLISTSESGWFSACTTSHTPIDFLYLSDSTTIHALKKYKVIIWPHAVILELAIADLLRDYVSGGGTVVFGARTGMKDRNGKCPMRPIPGPVAELCGINVIDFTFLTDSDNKASCTVDNATTVEMPVFNEILAPDASCDILARYTGNYYEGEPAVTCNQYGKGKAVYFGSAFSKQSAEFMLRYLNVTSPNSDTLKLDEDCELALRVAPTGRKYYFILNYSGSDSQGYAFSQMKDLLSDNTVNGNFNIPPYGVLILTNEQGLNN